MSGRLTLVDGGTNVAAVRKGVRRCLIRHSPTPLRLATSCSWRWFSPGPWPSAWRCSGSTRSSGACAVGRDGPCERMRRLGDVRWLALTLQVAESVDDLAPMETWNRIRR